MRKICKWKSNTQLQDVWKTANLIKNGFEKNMLFAMGLFYVIF